MQIRSLYTTVLLLFFFLMARAGELEYINSFRGEEIKVQPTKLSVEDDWYLYMRTATDYEVLPLNTSGQQAFNRTKRFSVVKAEGHVSLRWDASSHNVLGDWTRKVQVKVNAWDYRGVWLGQQIKVLEINYIAGHTESFKDFDELRIRGAHKLEVEILSVWNENNAPVTIGPTLSDIVLEATIEVERYFKLDLTLSPTLATPVLDATARTLSFAWNYVEGAEEYDLEWVFVSEEQSSSPVLDWDNASRVSLSATNYQIALPYENGNLHYRVRAVSFGNKNKQRLYGAWTADASEYLNYPGQSTGNIAGYELEMNWTYSASYAEEGKRVEILGFADGSGRGRQTVTKDNESGDAIVGESFYDYEGRAAVQVSPSVSSAQRLGFYQDYSLNGSVQLSSVDFDMTSHILDPATLSSPLITTGAGQYYSAANPRSTTAEGAYIGSTNYPFTRTVYDAWGRAYLQSGAGDGHFWGSGKETRYDYGTVSQNELDALFGLEAGHAEHYRQQIMTDANGQKSLVIESMGGQQVATALIGTAANLDNLDSDKYRYTTAQIRVDNWTPFNRPSVTEGVVVWEISRDISAVESGPYTIDYNFSPPTDFEPCYSPVGNPTYIAAEYALEFHLYNWLGEEVQISATNATMGSGNGTALVTTLSQLNGPISIQNSVSNGYVSFVLNVGGTTGLLPPGTYRLVKRLRLLNLEEIEEQLRTAIVALDPSSNDCYAYTDLVLYESSCHEEEIVDGTTVEDILAGVSLGITTFENLSCADMLLILKSDMSPGGQYFDNTPNSSSPNDWLINNIVSNASVYTTYGFNYTDLSGSTENVTGWDDVRTYWDDSWADDLVVEHPEYCFYENTCSTSTNLRASMLYDRDLKENSPSPYNAVVCSSPHTIHDIITLDPVASVITNFDTDMMDLICTFQGTSGTGSINMFETAVRMVSTSVAYSSMSSTQQIQVSNYFEQLYVGEKKKLVDAWLDAQCNNISVSRLTDADADPSNSFVSSGGFEIRYPRYEDIINNTQTQSTTTTSWDNIEGHVNDLADDYAPCGYAAATVDIPCLHETYATLGANSLVLQMNFPTTANPFGLTQVNISADISGCWNLDTDCNTTVGACVENCYGGISCVQSAIESQLATLLGTDWEDDYRVEVQMMGSGLTSGIRIIIHGLNVKFTSSGSTTVTPDYTNVTLGLYVNNSGSYTQIGSIGAFEQVECEGAYRLCLCEEIDYYYNEEGLTNPQLAALYVDQFPNVAWATIGSTIAGSSLGTQAGAEAYLTAVYSQCTTAYAAGASIEVLEDQDEMADLIDELLLLGTPEELQCWGPSVPNCEEELTVLEGFYEAEEIAALQTAAIAAQLTAYINHFMPDDQTKGPDRLTNTYNTLRYHYTLYYYDVAGNLVRTVPPAGVHMLTSTNLEAIEAARAATTPPILVAGTNVPNHVQITTYKYTTLGGAYASTSPDRGTVNSYFDDLGRPVVTQSAKQAAATTAEASYIVYDALGRIAESGVLLENTGMFTFPSNHFADALLDWPNNTNFGKQEVHWVDYNESGVNMGGQFAQGQRYLRNRVASQRYSFTGDVQDLDHAIAYSYDVQGNAEEVVQRYHYYTGNTTYKKMRYDFDLISGVVHKVYYQEGRIDQLTHHYSYDANNRLRKSETSLDGYIWDTDAKYEYYAHGPLRRVEIGEDKVQALDYIYTVHGWIKSVNSTTLEQDHDPGRDSHNDSDIHAFDNLHQWVSRDIYGYNVHYYDGDYNPLNSSVASPISDIGNYTNGLFNGNIRSVVLAQTRPEDVVGTINQGALPVAWKEYGYDQLNRILSSTTSEVSLDDLQGSTWAQETTALNVTAGQHATNYSYDANGNILTLNRYSGTIHIDELSYEYNRTGGTSSANMPWSDANYFTNNQLLYVSDAKGAVGDDIDNQLAANKFDYDFDGNLIGSVTGAPLPHEEIDEIIWTADGKVKEVIRTSSSSKPDLSYTYDVFGNRILKKTQVQGSTISSYTHYVRDVQGNIMGTYTYDIDASISTWPYSTQTIPEVYLKEHVLYGSSRLGVIKRDLLVSGPIRILNDGVEALNLGTSDQLTIDYALRSYWNFVVSKSNPEISTFRGFYAGDTNYVGHVLDADVLQSLAVEGQKTGLYVTSAANSSYIPYLRQFERVRGQRRYELNNFRGDMKQIISDIRIPIDNVGSDNIADYYEADVYQVEDAYPFGWRIETRSFAVGEEHRVGFNGKENDKDWGGQLIQDYGFRLYNPSIGKFLSVDPLAPNYPSWTPYAFAMNSPIANIDLDGLEMLPMQHWKNMLGTLQTIVQSQTSEQIAASIEGATEAIKNNVALGINQLMYDLNLWSDPIDKYESPQMRRAYIVGRLVGDVSSILIGAGEIGSGLKMTGGSGGSLAIAGEVVAVHGALGIQTATIDALKSIQILNAVGGPGNPPNGDDGGSYSIDDDIKETKNELNKIYDQIEDSKIRVERIEKLEKNDNLPKLIKDGLKEKYNQEMNLQKELQRSKTQKLDNLNDLEKLKG